MESNLRKLRNLWFAEVFVEVPITAFKADFENKLSILACELDKVVFSEKYAK